MPAFSNTCQVLYCTVKYCKKKGVACKSCRSVPRRSWQEWVELGHRFLAWWRSQRRLRFRGLAGGSGESSEGYRHKKGAKASAYRASLTFLVKTWPLYTLPVSRGGQEITKMQPCGISGPASPPKTRAMLNCRFLSCFYFRL